MPVVVNCKSSRLYNILLQRRAVGFNHAIQYDIVSLRKFADNFKRNVASREINALGNFVTWIII